MDHKDEAVLAQLAQDPTLQANDISQRTGIPVTTVHNRLKKLESSGVISGRAVEINYAALGYVISAVVLVTVSSERYEGRRKSQAAIAQEISALPGVESVEIVTGEADMVIRARARDMRDLDIFIVESLRNIDGIDKTRTLLVLNRFTPTGAIGRGIE